jgi:hypothetical protein
MDDITNIYKNSNLLIRKYLGQLEKITEEYFWTNLNKDISSLMDFYKNKNINMSDICITINEFFEIILKSKEMC